MKEENHTVNVSRRHYYYFKFYDKSQEIIDKRRKFNLPIDDVPRDLLRMEIVFVERTLDKLFKSAVKAEVEKRLAGNAPKGNGDGANEITHERFKKMSLTERNQLYRDNRELYDKLKG